LTLRTSKISFEKRLFFFKKTTKIRGEKMLKKILTFATILLVISCSSKSKKNEETQSSEVEIEDKSTEQNSYQAISDEEQAQGLDKQTQAKIEEVEVQDRVLFGYDSSDLSDEAKKILDTQSAWLNSDPSIKITIEGHCDERGTREYNIALGEKRAIAAKNHLVLNKVDESRIKVISYGKEKPAFFGNNEESLAKNRRSVTVVN
jgi:peptidoglycan-associated lipoprotein